MLVHNNEITIVRGEAFSMSKLIQNRDGSPYIVSSKLKSPHWKVTVTSSLNNSTDRYVLNKWLSLKDFPRFDITQPVNLKDINPAITNFELSSVPAKYEGDETSGYANKAVFYLETQPGVIIYKYWEYNNNEKGNFNGKWVDYKCPIITTFNTEITSKWAERPYWYNITLVDGDDTYEYLKSTALSLGLEVYDESVEKIYEKLLAHSPENFKNLNISIPILEIETLYPILESTKLYVKSN